MRNYIYNHLISGEAGETLLVTEHSRGVAMLIPLPGSVPLIRKAKGIYRVKELSPLMKTDPLRYLEEERREKW